MPLTSLVRDHLLATAVLSVVLVALTMASAFGVVVLVVVAVLSGGAGLPLDLLMALSVGGVVLGVPLSTVSVVGVAYGVVVRLAARLTHPGTWVTRRAEALERRSLVARLVGLSDRVAAVDPRSPRGRVEDRLDRLKTRYVTGEVSLFELERLVGETLAAVERSREPASTDRASPVGVRHRDRRRERES